MVYSKEVIKEFTLTINICLYSLMPTMFFQVFFSNILINSNISKYLPNTKLISSDELLILLLSIFSGYPNNIKMVKEYNNEYLNYSTNYINPLFLFGTVGAVYIKNINIIIMIYISHFLSNIILLFLLRKKCKTKANKKEIKRYTFNYYLKTTINTLSIIFSNLLLISLLITFLKLVLPFNSNIKSFIIGIIEFSRGIYEISKLNISIYIKGLLILIIITFNSISIHFQIISLNEKIKYIKFLKYRILNVFISIIIYLIISLFYQF